MELVPYPSVKAIVSALGRSGEEELAYGSSAGTESVTLIAAATTRGVAWTAPAGAGESTHPAERPAITNRGRMRRLTGGTIEGRLLRVP